MATWCASALLFVYGRPAWLIGDVDGMLGGMRPFRMARRDVDIGELRWVLVRTGAIHVFVVLMAVGPSGVWGLPASVVALPLFWSGRILVVGSTLEAW